jgi:hypothetical protein
MHHTQPAAPRQRLLKLMKQFCLPGQLLPTILALHVRNTTACADTSSKQTCRTMASHACSACTMQQWSASTSMQVSCILCTSDRWHCLPHPHTIRHSCACALHLPSCPALLLQPQPQALLSRQQQQQQCPCPVCLSCQHLLPLLLLGLQLQPDSCCSWWTCRHSSKATAQRHRVGSDEPSS